ncbi:MAG: DedA family protein [Alicyclobacillaceae bacterium]|jgi:membrane protein DedA with SNARE-associated domain|nr:DedA family protein [Alicyclobacillaceae bacterium]
MLLLHWIETYRYYGLFILLASEYFILIVPGETELTTAGALAHRPAFHLNFFELILSTSLGTFSGAMMAYGIGRLFGRPFLLKYGKYMFLTPKRLEQSELLFEKHTIAMLVVSRYIAFVRDIVPYIAGIQRVSLKIVTPILFLSSFLWTSSFLLAGNYIMKAFEFIRVHEQSILPLAIFLFITGGIGYLYIHRRIQRWAKSTMRAAPSGTSHLLPSQPVHHSTPKQ